MINKSWIEAGLLFAVLFAHLAAFFMIWFAPNFSVATVRQDLTLIIAPVTAAYFLAGIRFSIATQYETSTVQVKRTYGIVVAIVMASFLGGVAGTLLVAGWFSPMDPNSIKIFVGAMETFLGADVEHTDEMVRQVDEALLEIGRVEKGDLVVIIAGSPPGIPGSTNALRIHRMGDAIDGAAPAYRRGR